MTMDLILSLRFIICKQTQKAKKKKKKKIKGKEREGDRGENRSVRSTVIRYLLLYLLRLGLAYVLYSHGT